MTFTLHRRIVKGDRQAIYKNFIENHIVPAIGEIRLEKLTALEIQKMYNQTKTEGRVPRFNSMETIALSNRSVRGVHMVLHEALEQAVAERLIVSSPTNGCRIPNIEKEEAASKMGSFMAQSM